MLAEPHQYLAQIYPRYDFHQFIQDVADQEVRIFSRVVVDLEYLPIAVDRTCARVAAKAIGGVATFPYVLKLVAWPDELRRRACARQYQVVTRHRLGIEALTNPWHPDRYEYTEERVGEGEGPGRHDQSVVGAVERRFRHGAEPEYTVEAVEDFAAARACAHSSKPDLVPGLAPGLIGIRLGELLQCRDVALHLLGDGFEGVRL